MEHDFQSLSKGVFVVPFRASAGPSRPARPIKRVYDETLESYRHAHELYEKSRMEEQLDDIADWLDSKSAPSIIRPMSGAKRISIAIIQNISDQLPSQLGTLVRHVHNLQAKEAMDLTTAMRNIAARFVGEDASAGRKSGRSGMDEVESWYDKQKDRKPLLLHIQHAQLIPPMVLSELIYILAIHPNVPIRLILSVSSTTLFLSSWTHVEPCLIDLTVIQAGRGRKRGAAVNAILKSGTDLRQAPVSIGEDLAEELRVAEEMTGGGAASALKALQWSLLHHSFNSPLADLEDRHLEQIQAVVSAVKDGRTDVPGSELLRLSAHSDFSSAHNPAPRISILHALSSPSSFAPERAKVNARDTTPTPRTAVIAKSSPRTPRQTTEAETTPAPIEEMGDEEAEGGDLKELEMMFGLWRSAGRNVNLWDWLEGFRGAMTEKKDAHEDKDGEHKDGEYIDGEGKDGEDKDVEGDKGEQPKKKRKESHEEDQKADNGDGKPAQPGVKVDLDAETQDRLHATFVRFCEEARMLGLVRARGGRTAKKADEVVKGIGLV